MKRLLILFFSSFFISFSITISAQCDASFTVVEDCGCVTFTPNFIDATNCSYTWNFGVPNATSNEISPTYCYEFPGGGTSSVGVNLSINCSAGAITCDSTINVTVDQVPDAALEPVNADGWINCEMNASAPIISSIC